MNHAAMQVAGVVAIVIIVTAVAMKEIKIVGKRRRCERARLETLGKALDSGDRQATANALTEFLLPAMMVHFVRAMMRLSPERGCKFVAMFGNTPNEGEETW